MPLEIKVPSLGQSVPEATVGKWLKNEGDAVAADEAVVELETDKINLEVTAFRAGTLAEIRKGSGETVAVGEVLGIIAQEGEAAKAEEKPKQAEPTEKKTAEPAKREQKAARPEPEEEPAEESESVEEGEEAVAAEAPPPAARRQAVVPDRLPVSPAVRRLAREHKLDLTGLEGSGRGGRVTREDVLAYLESAPTEGDGKRRAAEPRPNATGPTEAPSGTAEPVAAPGREYAPDEPVERVPMTPIRKTIARRMAESRRTAAHVTTVDECDMGILVELRERIKDDFFAQHAVKLTYMPFIMKAALAALRDFPDVNASIEGDQIVYHRFYHIGVAVHTEAGLVVPVVKHADRKSMVEIARAIDELAKKARERKLTMEEIQGGTFTLTNAGGYGAILSTPIISQPESAVLGIHKIVERPIARDGMVVIRPMLWFGLSYDHRLVDGTPAVLFLRRICTLLEDPERLLLQA